MHDAVFLLPSELTPGQPLYARVEPVGRGAEELRFSRLDADRGTGERRRAHAHDRAHFWRTDGDGVCGAADLVRAVRISCSSSTRALFSLQALYVAYLSGQGFEWPLLSYALPLGSYAWNVPAALSGAAACLFVRDIADLKRFYPRVYTIFGWLALAVRGARVCEFRHASSVSVGWSLRSAT